MKHPKTAAKEVGAINCHIRDVRSESYLQGVAIAVAMLKVIFTTMIFLRITGAKSANC